MSAWIEERIAELASRQHGLVTRAQLLDAGLTGRMVRCRLEVKRLRRVHRGVYLAGPLVPPRAREMAAVLACGAGARASHRSGAWLLDLMPRPGESSPVDVRIKASSRVRRPGIRVHRCGSPGPDEGVTVDGIPVTAPAATLVDLAGVVGARELEQAVARAERAGLVTLDDLAARTARRRGRPGMATLAALLERDGGPSFTRSELEARFVELVPRYGLPSPKVNVRVAGYELDCYWPDARLAVELDGEAYHASWTSQQSDRRRDSDLAAADILVLRVTWRQLVQETAPTMVRVAQALALRRHRVGAARA